MDISKVKFEEFPNGVVKASISDCRYDAINKINRKFVATTTSAIEIDSTWNKASKEYRMNNTYSAIAKCSQDDEYSFEVGKKIALKKLNEKYNRSIDKRIARFLMHMDQVCKSLDKYFENRTF
jgi:hypothetical protein